MRVQTALTAGCSDLVIGANANALLTAMKDAQAYLNTICWVCGVGRTGVGRTGVGRTGVWRRRAAAAALRWRGAGGLRGLK